MNYIATKWFKNDTLFSFCAHSNPLGNFDTTKHIFASLHILHFASKLFIIIAIDWCCRYAMFSSSISFWLPSIGIVYFYIEVSSMHPPFQIKKRKTKSSRHWLLIYWTWISMKGALKAYREFPWIYWFQIQHQCTE